MTKICTTIEQSKKLIEFGVDVNTADMIHNILGESYVRHDTPIDKYHTPAWSLSSLMNLLPSEFIEVGKYSTIKYEIHIRKYKFTDDTDLHQIAYGNYKIYEDGSSSWKDMINTGEKEELLDAAFEMVCWLKENNKI